MINNVFSGRSAFNKSIYGWAGHRGDDEVEKQDGSIGMALSSAEEVHHHDLEALVIF